MTLFAQNRLEHTLKQLKKHAFWLKKHETTKKNCFFLANY